VTTQFGVISSVDARALILQPDGKLVVAGSLSWPLSWDFALARYNPDGSSDATFGVGGMVTTDFGRPAEGAYALILQPDGKLVAAGSSYYISSGTSSNFALARYEGTTPFPDLTGTWNSLTQICRTTPHTQRCRLMGRFNITNQGAAKVRRASFLRLFLSSDGITPETLPRLPVARSL